MKGLRDGGLGAEGMREAFQRRQAGCAVRALAGLEHIETEKVVSIPAAKHG